MQTTHLLYLHGFRSSPASTKACMVANHVARHHPCATWWCPQLPASPRAAIDLLQAGTQNWPRASMAVMGSSLGGFYARWLAEETGCRAIVLNPAVHPARDLASYIGEHPSWHDPQEVLFFRPEFVDELRALSRPAITHPERYLAVIAKGDELLDWREMQAYYSGANIRLLEGSDHALSDFSTHIEETLQFLDLC